MAILTTTHNGLNFTGGTTYIQTGATTLMAIEEAGNVGIGTASPGRKLEVDFTGSVYGAKFTRSDATGSSLIEFANSAGIKSIIGYDAGVDGYKIGTASATNLVVKQSGYVGIGTTLPKTYLDIVEDDDKWHLMVGGATKKLLIGGQAASGDVVLQAGAASTANNVAVTTAYNLCLQRDGGNVGIGTASPGTKLDVDGSIRLSTSGKIEGRAYPYTTNIGSNANATTTNIKAGSTVKSEISLIGGDVGDRIEFKTDSTERMRIDSSGKVGIGTTTPNAKLDIQGTQGQLFSVTDDLSGDIFSVADISGVPILNVNSSGLVTVDGTSYFDGNVGIGTDSPNDTLEVEGGITITSLTPAKLLLNNTKNGTWTAGEALGLIDFYGNDTSGGGAKIQSSIEVLAHDQYGAHFNMTFNLSNGAPGNSERLRITGEGRIGIGTTAPLATLHVYNPQNTNGNIGFISDASAGGTGTRNMHINLPNYGEGIRFLRSGTYSGGAMKFYNGTSNVGGVQINTSSTSFNTTSDYRAKENVVPMENSINRLKELKPCRFNFIIEPENTVDGFIAHEAQEVVPEAITGEKDKLNYEGNPEYQGIDQSKIVPLLTAALQEAISKIEQLETRIQTLENN